MGKRSNLRFQPASGTRAASVPVGKKQRLQIERLAHDGRGIGFVEGRSWFVSGALPGEQVEARVLSARAQVVEARCLQVLQASAQRQPPRCAHAGSCGGCTLQHMGHAEQLALKQQALAEQLQRQAGLVPRHWAEPLSAGPFAYRRRTRVALRWDPRQQRLEVGFRAAASQDIVAVSQCPVLADSLQAVLQALPALFGGFERPQALGHVELFEGTACALLLRHTAPLTKADLQRLRTFCDERELQLWLQGAGEPQPDQPDSRLGYHLDGLLLDYRPGDFVQVNAEVNRLMVAQALEWLAPRPDEAVLDLYCGLGNFALALAGRAARVLAVEGVEAMCRRAADNARHNHLDNLQCVQADLSRPLDQQGWADQRFSAVLLDPPRDGALEVVRQLRGLGAQRVLYVSCNPATLARDAGLLAGQGYQLVRAGILDMFPQTAHVEAMALFESGI